MPKRAEEYTIFQRTLNNGGKAYCVYYRDEDGKRMNPIFVSKLKKLLYKGKHGEEPIKDEKECIKICEKSLRTSITSDFIFNREKPESPAFIDYVRMIGDYNNSPYIKGRLKEGNNILKHTTNSQLNSFNNHIASLIPPKLTLKDIDNSNGAELTKIRDKVIDLDISPTIKNKGLQCMRDALKYASQRSLIKNDYLNRLKNSKVNDIKGQDSLETDEINKVISYYNEKTEKGTWERYKYLVSLLAATTSMRPKEIMGLKRQDIIKIDTENDCGILYINHSINCDEKYSTRKNKKSVYEATYISLIEEMLNFCDSNPVKSDWIFWDRNHPENHLTQDQFKGIPKATFSEIGVAIDNRKLSFYSLRKTAATIIGNNRSHKHNKSASLLGHSNIGITERHYITNTIEGAIDNFDDIRQYIKLPA